MGSESLFGSLGAHGPSFEGAVRLIAGEDEIFEFSLGKLCERWISVPVNMVQDLNLVGSLTCNGERYSYVRMRLKMPKTAEGRIFAQLCGLMRGRPNLNPRDLAEVSLQKFTNEKSENEEYYFLCYDEVNKSYFYC